MNSATFFDMVEVPLAGHAERKNLESRITVVATPTSTGICPTVNFVFTCFMPPDMASNPVHQNFFSYVEK